MNRQAFWADVHAGIVDVLVTRPVRLREFVLGVGRHDGLDFAKSRGALLLGPVEPSITKRLERHSIPFVNVYDKSDAGAVVGAALAPAVKSMVGLFSSQGAGRLVYMDRFHAGDWHLNAYKFQCVERCAAELGMECLYVHSKTGNAEAYAAVMELLKTSKIEGMVLSSDFIAPGAYRALYDSGLRIPQDVRIASFDNLEIASYMIPSLSSIDLKRCEAGEKAAGMLMEMMTGAGGRRVSLDAEFVVRESTSGN
jgi:DNA-binding LacI/PurR family transcriptional regulator